MKMESVYRCSEVDVLAKDVYTKNGNLLVKSGSNLSKENLQRLYEHSIAFVYLEDENFDDIVVDKNIDEIKQATLQNISEDFSQIVYSGSKNISNTTKTVNEMVAYINQNPEINISLYEIKSFDDYTYIHSVNTAIMAGYLGKKLGFSKEQLKDLCLGAIFHDIGKLKIPAEIINKNGPLTSDEYYEITKHPIYGRDIAKDFAEFSPAVLNGILYHHERVDGKGYPFGLKDNDISTYAKIISVCDVFTAVSAKRSYRNRFHPNDSYELILSNSGIMFNREVVDIFRKHFYIYPLGCHVKLSNGIEGYVVKQNNGFPDKPLIRVTYSHISKRPINPYEIDLVTNTNVIVQNVMT